VSRLPTDMTQHERYAKPSARSGLDEKVRRAAAMKGESVPEFLRRAAAARAEETLASDLSECFADVAGVIPRRWLPSSPDRCRLQREAGGGPSAPVTLTDAGPSSRSSRSTNLIVLRAWMRSIG